METFDWGNHEDFANRLKTWRRLNRIKQGALAHMLGVSQSAISFWENGLDRPSEDNMRRLSAVVADSVRDEARIERLFVERQMALRVLCDFDGVRLITPSRGYRNLWPETAELVGESMADRLVNEAQILMFDPEYRQPIEKGELVVASGISERLTSLELDTAYRCQWHVCFRRYSYRTILDIVFEPCEAHLQTGITDLQYL